MSLYPISVTIITLNEEKNIARAIQSVRWADDIVVVDSGSTDQTIQIAQKLGARTFHQEWRGYGQQKNYAQDQAQYDWVLNLDADEEVSPELTEELQNLIPDLLKGSSEIRGFYLPRKTFYLGKWILHGGWYPNYLIRFGNRQFCRWSEPKVHESWKVTGETQKLVHPLLHYSFENIESQIKTNLRYSLEGHEEMKKKGQKKSLIKLLLKPPGKFIETFFIKRGFLDGWPGFIISINAAHSIFLKYAYFFDEERRKD
jgi:glycosyltransferase involved in cell wall biosynthesis